MRLNDTASFCCKCHAQLRAMEGRVLWDEGFFRTFCKLHAEELLHARQQRKRNKKNAGITPMF